MSQHTPGPWEAEETSGAYVVCELTGGWSVVATNADPNKYSPEDDARLIAAAPKLLEELVDRYDQTRCGCGHWACARCQDDATTLAVIREAKGETDV